MSLRVPRHLKVPTATDATEAGIRFFKLRLLPEMDFVYDKTGDGRSKRVGWRLVPQSALDFQYKAVAAGSRYGADVVDYFTYTGKTPDSAYNNFLKRLRNELEAQIRHQANRR